MGKSLSVSALSLRTSAARLNALADEAAVLVRELERFLGEECSLGVYASVKVAALDPDGEYSRLIQYRRHASRFRIVVTEGSCEEDEDSKPWSDCSRDVKLQSFERLPELVSEITKQLDAKIRKAEATVESVAEILAPYTKSEE